MSERLRNIAIAATTAYVVHRLSNSAFSFKSRKQIVERDGGACTVCGATDHIEAAHYNHKRGGNYDNPKNGRILCRPHHYIDHLQAENNGLSQDVNSWAAGKIWDRMTEEEQKRAVGIIYFNEDK